MSEKTELGRFEEESNEESDMRVVKLWFTGSCVNQGMDEAEGGYAFRIQTGDSRHFEDDEGSIENDDEETVTNNVAEYKALIRGLQTIRDEYADDDPLKVEAYGNANIVIGPIGGRWELDDERLRRLKRESQRLLNQFDRWQIERAGDVETLDCLGYLSERAARHGSTGEPKQEDENE
jgi:ribonuclease HI